MFYTYLVMCDIPSYWLAFAHDSAGAVETMFDIVMEIFLTKYTNTNILPPLMTPLIGLSSRCVNSKN